MAKSTSSSADRLIRDQKQHQKVVQLWIFLGCVLGLLTLVNLLCALHSCLRKRSPMSSPQQQADFDKEGLGSTAPAGFLKRCTAMLVTTYRVFAFRVLLPVGFGAHLLPSEVVFICIYITSLLIWLLVDTRDLNVEFYEDRAAHLASCQLPLIVALAGKNNIISFLTGVSHEKLNVLHRAAARAILLLLWLHAVSRIVSGLPPQFDFTHNWVRSGVTGLAALTFAAILSLKPVRTAAFELFFLSHIVLIFIFLVSGYCHAREQGMGGYIWPALMLWALDRALRGLRVVWNNRLWIFGGSKYSLAAVELVSSDTIRLTLARRFSWKPGQHAYITLPTISRLPLEAHPFTIASIPGSLRTGASNDSEDNQVVFLIRGCFGMTGRLRHFASRENGSTPIIPVLVDGPYGCPPDLLTFTTSILVAGGSGISYILPLFLNLLRSRSAGIKSETQRVVFIWAIRDAGMYFASEIPKPSDDVGVTTAPLFQDHLEWISKTLSEALDASPSNLSIEPRIYITGSKLPSVVSVLPNMTPSAPTPSVATSTASNSKPEISVEEKHELPAYSALKIIHGRPSIRKLLYDEISACSGSISVDVAGPSSLSDSVRRALSSGVASPRAAFSGIPSVTLHVEKFGL